MIHEDIMERNTIMLSAMVELVTIFDMDIDLLVFGEMDVSIPQDKYVHIDFVHNAMVDHNGVNRIMQKKLYKKGLRFPKMRMWVRQFIPKDGV